MKHCPCDDSVPRSLVSFESRYDGSTKQVFVMGPWPGRVCFAREFLSGTAAWGLFRDGVGIQCGENIVTITCTNGKASYGLDAENFECNTVCGVKSPEPQTGEDEDDR